MCVVSVYVSVLCVCVCVICVGLFCVCIMYVRRYARMCAAVGCMCADTCEDASNTYLQIRKPSHAPGKRKKGGGGGFGHAGKTNLSCWLVELMAFFLYSTQTRHMFVIVDGSSTMLDKDLRPDRLTCTIKVCKCAISFECSFCCSLNGSLFIV